MWRRIEAICRVCAAARGARAADARSRASPRHQVHGGPPGRQTGFLRGVLRGRAPTLPRLPGGRGGGRGGAARRAVALRRLPPRMSRPGRRLPVDLRGQFEAANGACVVLRRRSEVQAAAAAHGAGGGAPTHSLEPLAQAVFVKGVFAGQQDGGAVLAQPLLAHAALGAGGHVLRVARANAGQGRHRRRLCRRVGALLSPKRGAAVSAGGMLLESRGPLPPPGTGAESGARALAHCPRPLPARGQTPRGRLGPAERRAGEGGRRRVRSRPPAGPAGLPRARALAPVHAAVRGPCRVRAGR